MTMNESASPFGEASQPKDFAALTSGRDLGALRVTVSPAANRRYFEAAGVTHPSLEAGALYPPIATNLTILLLQTACTTAVLHTRQRLSCHDRAAAGTPLVVTGAVSKTYRKRNREYIEVDATIADESGRLIWTSVATFTPVAP